MLCWFIVFVHTGLAPRQKKHAGRAWVEETCSYHGGQEVDQGSRRWAGRNTLPGLTPSEPPGPSMAFGGHS